MIKFYKKNLSPLKKHATCIYTPTCSQYAIEAIEKYGINEEYRKSYKPVQKIIEKQGNF